MALETRARDRQTRKETPDPWHVDLLRPYNLQEI